MNKKYLVFSLLLLAVLVVSVVPMVRASPVYLLDDDSGWFNSGAGIVVSNETTEHYDAYGCVQIVFSGSWVYVYHNFGSGQDFTDNSIISFYYKGDNAQQVRFACITEYGVSDYYFTLTCNGDWQLFSAEIDTGTAEGSPNVNSIQYIGFESRTYGGFTLYVDYMWLGENNVTLIINDPLYATLTPVVGSHSYLEGSILQVNATMLADYTFLKYSFYPVSDSTSNPAWVIMSENITCTATLLPPMFVPSGMSYISFILMFATGLIFLLLSFYCTGRKTVGAIIFPVLSVVVWVVLTLTTFIIGTATVTFVDWIPSTIYVALSILSALLGIWNVFNFVAESAKITVEEE